MDCTAEESRRSALARQISQAVAAFFVSSPALHAALIVNPAMPISHQITVNPIIVSDDGGADSATFFGTSGQQATIEMYVDAIWAQAGIDVVFKSPTTYDSTFALRGTSNPRPASDLAMIVSNAGIAGGILDPDPDVINMFFVDIPAGFGPPSSFSASGSAFIGGNGITQYVDANLPTFTTGQELVASVVSRHIGHNLGLQFIVEAENLLQTGPSQGERLNASQISTALGSSFSVPIPEPSTGVALLGAGCLLLQRRSRILS